MDGKTVRAPAVNMPNLKMHPSALICRGATIEGEVTVGAGTIIHPFAMIRATKGPIVIGDNNNIEEGSLIENVSSEEGHVMTIGDGNNIEVHSVVRANSIGNRNNFAVRSEVGPGVEIGNGVFVGAKCQLMGKGSVPDRLAIWGAENNRRVASVDPDDVTELLEAYRKILPSYHHIYKASA